MQGRQLTKLQYTLFRVYGLESQELEETIRLCPGIYFGVCHRLPYIGGLLSRGAVAEVMTNELLLGLIVVCVIFNF